MTSKRDMYIDLDNRLENLMKQFWEDYPEQPGTISISGSVLFGEWHVQRDGFDGLKFKPTEKQTIDLISGEGCIVKDSDIINQKEYDKDD